MKKLISAVLAVAVVTAVTLLFGLNTFAASPKISRTSFTIIEGKSHTLTVTGYSGKITWSSSNKIIANVSSKGKVEAKSPGAAVISAKCGNITLKCAVTVLKKNAAFSETKLPKFDAKAPYGIDLGGIEMTTVNGVKLKSEDVFGKYDLTMINIWATWCGPCVRELPELEKLYENYKSKGVNIIGILSDTDYTSANTLISSAGVKYNVFKCDNSVLKNFVSPLQYVPTTIFVDSSGKIVGGYMIGSRDYSSWSYVVDSILGAKK